MADVYSAEIVESPITTAKIEAAMGVCRDAIVISTPITVTPFNQGRSILITASVEA